MFIRTPLRGLVAAAVMTASGLGVAVAATTPTFAATPAASLPSHVFAPYVDTGFTSVNGALPGSTLSTIASNYGDKYFTLAFVDGAGCQWNMFNSAMYQSEVSSLQAAGGNALISFGGYNSDTNGTDLGSTCSSASAMATQVEGVVNYFNPAGIDFDIESSELTNTTDVNRTNQALAMVRSWANSNGRSSMDINYTLPVLSSGLTSPGLNVLTNGKANGFRPNIVNVMAFDFGSSGTEMGQAAEQGLANSASQVGSTYGTNGITMTGLTVMPGQNDSAGEVFTLSDGSSVESYAASSGSPLLTFWSEGRDNGGCPGQTSASSTCSGLSQNTGQFTSIFKAFTSGGSGGGGYPSGYHQLVANSDSLCVDVAGDSTANNAVVDQWSCKSSGNANQEWQFNSVSGGYGELQNQNSGKDLVVQGASTANGAKIIQYTQNGTTNGLWKPVKLSNGSWQFQNEHSGQCLDVTGASSTLGVQLDQWPCKSNAAGGNQAFATR
ncbi:MAG TPA: RICIN domain-containing protein [Streptosporangiaceae bacterium]|nr:RICIN domain-containing protein [Streptosporangiaceae bacterium]